jgi:lambda repressor-like predicted transcriptional regulator
VDKDGTIDLPELTAASLPSWLPAAVRHYLDHTEEGTSLRALARRDGVHASTVLRQVRRFEGRREDPLMDEALEAIARLALRSADAPARKEDPAMSAALRHPAKPILCDESLLAREGRRVLRRLAEPGAVMAIAPEMEKAAVLRELPDGRSLRTAVLDRAVAQAFTLQDWIACRKPGRVATYEITAAGRAALKRMTEAEEQRRRGVTGAASFGDQHRVWDERDVMDDAGPLGCATTLRKAPWRCWAAGSTGMASPSSPPNWSMRRNVCARTSNLRRWARAWRRTGTAS